MRKLEIYEIFEKVAKAKKKADKVKVLQENDSIALRDVLQGTFDSRVVWLLPEGKPPYTPSKEETTPSTLLRQNKMFTYFVKGGKGDNLVPVKRENIFIGMLEGIHPKDAEIMLDYVIAKKAPPGITKALVNTAFEGLIA